MLIVLIKVIFLPTYVYICMWLACSHVQAITLQFLKGNKHHSESPNLVICLGTVQIKNSKLLTLTCKQALQNFEQKSLRYRPIHKVSVFLPLLDHSISNLQLRHNVSVLMVNVIQCYNSLYTKGIMGILRGLFTIQ